MISPNKKKLHFNIWSSIAQIVGIIVVTAIVVLITERIIESVSDSLLEKRKITHALVNKKETQDRLARDLARLAPHEKALRDTLPPGNNILQFVETLEDLAKQRGLKQTYTFGVPTEPTGNFPLSRIDFSIGLRANVHTLREYLGDLLSIPYIIKINSVSLGAPQEGWIEEGTVTISATLFVKSPE